MVRRRSIIRLKSVSQIDNPLEEDSMRAVWEWAKLNPIVSINLHRIENGGSRRKIKVKTKVGYKYISPEGNKLKAGGLKSGTPDWIFLLPCPFYRNFWIEQKRRKGTLKDVSETQWDFINKVRSYGDRVDICFGAEETIEAIKSHLKLAGIYVR